MFNVASIWLVASLFLASGSSVFGQDAREPALDSGAAKTEAGDHGRALATLELARWHDPRNADVRAEIERLRTTLGAPEEADGWRAPFRYLTIEEWSFVLLGGAAMVGGVALVRGLRKATAPSTSWKKWVAASGVLMLAAAATGLFLQSQRLDEAIVHDANARVLLSPASAAQSVGSLHVGERVIVEGAHRSYLRIRSRGGLVGWLPDTAATSMRGASPTT